MNTVASLSYAIVGIPLENPIAFATQSVSVRHFGLLKIRTRDGAEGIGYSYLGAIPTRLVGIAIEEWLAPLVLGADVGQCATLWDAMYSGTTLHGRTGAVMRAISLVDNTLWDLRARAAGQPLYQFLGGAKRDSVKCYAAGGYYSPGKTAAKLAVEMAQLVAAGFTAVKMKTGKGAPHEEAERVKAVRAAIGDGPLLMLDANNAWKDVATAMGYLDLFAAQRPYWIEEPFSTDDIESHAALNRKTDITIALGENEAGRWRFGELLDRVGECIIQPDATACGGISEWLHIAALAERAKVTVCPHAYHDLHSHLAAAIPNAGMVEYMLGDEVMPFGKIIDRRMAHAGGEIVLPQTPGLGFQFVEQEVARYAVRPSGQTETWLTI